MASDEPPQPEEPPQPQGTEVQLEGRWINADDVPIVLANQLIAQAFQGTILLTFGQVGPPPLSGTPEDMARAARQLEFVPIRALARFSVPPGPFREMARALRTTADALDALDRQADTGEVVREQEPPE